MTEKGEPMLLIGLLTAEVTGGSEVIAAAEGTSAGDCFPEGGDDTEELSGLRESEKERIRFFSVCKRVCETTVIAPKCVILCGVCYSTNTYAICQ